MSEVLRNDGVGELTHVTKLYGVAQVKISKLLTDTASETTYDKPVTATGIQQLGFDPQFDEKQLEGDDKVLESDTKFKQMNFTFVNAKVSLDVLAILLGGKVTDVSTTPKTATYSLTNLDKPSYFKLEGQCRFTDVGDAHFILYKAKANKCGYTMAGNAYAIVSCSGVALGTVFGGKVQDIVLNETEKPIPDTATHLHLSNSGIKI